MIPETSSCHSIFDILRDKLEIILKGQLNHSGQWAVASRAMCGFHSELKISLCVLLLQAF